MDDFALAIAVANEGADIVRDRFGTRLIRLDKGSGDFATNADIEAEKAMLALLRRERPDDRILGEESGSSGSANSSRTWLIDPLCGTLNYAAKCGWRQLTSP
jgi:myo-inositol-1(or 4)-monophosphatase